MNSPHEPPSKDAIASTKSTRSRFKGYCSKPVKEEVAPQPPINERKLKLLPIQGEQLDFLGDTK